MGTIKLELDLPEFKKELNINITIKSDGEVVYSTSSPLEGSKLTTRDNQHLGGETKVSNNCPNSNNPPTSFKNIGGNFMNMDI